MKFVSGVGLAYIALMGSAHAQAPSQPVTTQSPAIMQLGADVNLFQGAANHLMQSLQVVAQENVELRKQVEELRKQLDKSKPAK